MPWLVLLIIFSVPLLGQASTPYKPGIQAIEKLATELVIYSKKGPVLSIRKVKINGRSNHLIRHGGAVINLSFEYRVHCRHCSVSNNQLLIGLHVQHSAQACVKLKRRQSKWIATRVELTIPHSKALHYIRARPSTAFNCSDALDWWRMDQPLGPGSEANIGVVQVLEP